MSSCETKKECKCGRLRNLSGIMQVKFSVLMPLEHDMLMSLGVEDDGEHGILLLYSWIFVQGTLMYLVLASQFALLERFQVTELG